MPRPPDLARETTDKLRDRLAAGEPGPGEWLPSRKQLATEYGVSPTTIRQALNTLANENWIIPIPGKGAKVAGSAPRVSRSASHQTQMRGRMRGFPLAAAEAGLRDWHEVLGIEDVPAPEEAARFLGVSEGTTVLCRSRIHGIIYVGRRVPVMLSWTWIHPDIDAQLPILRTPDTGSGGMTSRFIDAGYTCHWQEIVRARLATPAEAAALEMDLPAAVFDVWRPCFDQEDAVLEITRRVINAERQDLVFP